MTPRIVLYLLSITWAYAVYTYGAVESAPGRWSVLSIAAAALILWLLPQGQPAPVRFRRLDAILLFAAVLIGFLQLVPLPLSVIHVVSPHRAAELAVAAQVIGPAGSASLTAAPVASRDALLMFAAYVIVYLVTSDLRRRSRDRHWSLVVPLILVAAIEGVLGLLQYSSGAESSTGTYVNRNHFAGLLEMSLPFAVMLGIFLLTREGSRLQIAATPGILAASLFGAGAFILAGIVESHSRMGFIATLVSLFFMGAVELWRRSSQEGWSWRRWASMLGLAGAFVLAFVLLSSDKLIGRFAAVSGTREISEDTRRQLWKETMPLISDYALAGCGLGAYESCFLPYKMVAPGSTADYAHNDYLQVMAEFGLPAFACLLAVALMAYGTALRRTALGRSGRYLALACVGSLTAILMHSLVDFNLYIPANGMLAAWVAGIAREA